MRARLGNAAPTLPLDVSRETGARLDHFRGLVEKWSPRINLVSRAAVADLQERHIADSAQLWHLAPPARRWVDLGSGGGFPGMVIAILARELRPDLRVVLIESDTRKAAFLATAIRETDVNADIIAERIETVSPQAADIVSARALAPLERLLGLVMRHLAPGGRALLPKGAKWREEVENARRTWTFEADTIPSVTDPSAVILSIGEIARA
ncbi:16S rRNA (guanine(527)-N(7))-methyltransferase RsmG [Rhodosalinus sp. K401]|uniref:16S rRNA (guanine(527)-N(7))-methyltransferase RsmG n=1 Tax=Rhodosalinus sp. K401 TaxID=3239195 RepID=UPI0035233A6B